MKKIKLGQIGIGHNHGEPKMIAARRFLELFEIVGYAEENERWIEKRGSLSAYKGLARMSIEEIIEKSDALLIESDVWDLTKYAQMCIDAGKHIHMDKPASGTLAEWHHLLNCAEAKKLVIQMGYMYRYNPAILRCLEHIKNGNLGEIYSINAEMSTFHKPEYRRWLQNFNGGIMYILGSHLVDIIVYILGEPKKITPYLMHSRLDGIDLADNDLAVLEYDNALVRIFVSSVEVNGYGRRQFVVSGSRGTVNIMPIENPCKMTYSDISIATSCYADMKNEIMINDIANGHRYDGMMRDFYAYIIGEKQNPFTYEHDFTVQKVISEIIGGVGFNGQNID